MSDEYGNASGYQGSLVDDSLDRRDASSNPERLNSAEESSNYPNAGTDTTSSGGYGGDAFSRDNQRGFGDRDSAPDQGLYGGGEPQVARDSQSSSAYSSEGRENTGGYKQSTDAFDSSASGQANRRQNVTQSGGAAYEEGTFNNIGA